MDNKDEEFGQELVDVVRPPPQSTSELEDWTQMDQKEGNEMADTVTTHAAESSHQNTFVATSIQPTTRTTSLTTAAKEESTTAISNNDFPILGLPRTTQVIAPTPIPAAPLNKPATTTAAEDEALLLPPPSPPTPVPESTVTTDDLPLLETEQPQQHPLDTQVPLTESTAQKTPDVLPADPPTFTAADSQVDDGNSNNNKRTSVAATMAQSILGDRLEDFTEKLAFIKKNIIMSLEDEETMDEEDRVLKPSFSETNRRR